MRRALGCRVDQAPARPTRHVHSGVRLSIYNSQQTNGMQVGGHTEVTPQEVAGKVGIDVAAALPANVAPCVKQTGGSVTGQTGDTVTGHWGGSVGMGHTGGSVGTGHWGGSVTGQNGNTVGTGPPETPAC